VKARGVLLDYYGTVVREDHAHIMRVCEQVAAASPHQVEASEVGARWSRAFGTWCAASHGERFQTQEALARRSLGELLVALDVDLDPNAMCQPLYDYWAAPELYPESVDTLSRCALPICVVSNIDRGYLQRALVHNGVAFERVVTSEDSRAYKPRGEMFHRALQCLGLKPDQAIYVGDSLHSDVQGARSAGIPVLWINRRERLIPEGAVEPDYVSHDLAALLDLTGSRERQLKIVSVGMGIRLDHARALFCEYADWIGIDLGFQDFAQELATLPGAYIPPVGRLLLALQGVQVAGCVALRPLTEGICEMKRLYVRPSMRGAGIGRALVTEIMTQARAIGYERMRLDTLPWMESAIGLYRSMGFVDIAAYRHNPIMEAKYLEKLL
jgi:2-haloacid dehalogenase/putative hydrolase of the HAD superfamily